MDADFVDLLIDTITYEPPSGTVTTWGEETYGAAVAYTCHIAPVQGEVVVRSIDGRERKASWRIYVNTTTMLSPRGRLTLPTGFDPQQPPFFGVARVTDESGVHHMVVTV